MFSIRLVADFVKGQHHLLTSIVLHLRYPNAHTHWFSSLLLHLFQEVNDDRLREVMTKVLLERFIVHRPHPWGALVTFIELLRNPKYDFWSKDFIRIGPEVTMLLHNVSLFAEVHSFWLNLGPPGRKFHFLIDFSHRFPLLSVIHISVRIWVFSSSLPHC